MPDGERRSGPAPINLLSTTCLASAVLLGRAPSPLCLCCLLCLNQGPLTRYLLSFQMTFVGPAIPRSFGWIGQIK